MTRVTAIELENFQSIERRTRIELKPITLLFGPNSAGKSSVFDALELLRTLLDPTAFDEEAAIDMVDRWARRSGNRKIRETSLAIEFPFEFRDLYDVWSEEANWPPNLTRTQSPAFWIDEGDHIDLHGLQGATVRIDLTLKVINSNTTRRCYISEYKFTLKDRQVVSLLKVDPRKPDPEELDFIDSEKDEGYRWLMISDELGFASYDLVGDLTPEANLKNKDIVFTRTDAGRVFHVGVISNSLSPLRVVPNGHVEFMAPSGSPGRICANARDILFYFGTILFAPTRGCPGVVHSDRRAPKPKETLTVVDLGLRGWWSRNRFSPSSPALLLRTLSQQVDEHYQGLAEAAHADLALRAATAVFWGGSHAAEHIEPVRSHANVLSRVNHHLERNLFTEKLYKLTCASTLLVPIDLDEEDPWSYYALSQPAAVRLFLEDGSGQKIDFHDVGSGIPFVLPVLYAVVRQGMVKIQQPELHLHPALQSSLADVFVEEMHHPGSGQAIIETHSEHLLLRLLRRIRDTEKGKVLSDDLKLSNDQLAVYYFDPQVGGGTVVSRQLVTPLGDFYTDWPRGFFAERDGDLFDD